MSPLSITDVRFVAARPDQVERGMVGHVSLVLNDALKLDGIALRRTREGKPMLSFPARRDRSGQDHPFVRPLGSAARRQIEQRVFAELGIGEDAQ